MNTQEILILLEKDVNRTSYPSVYAEYPNRTIRQLARLLFHGWRKNYPEILGIKRQVINMARRAGIGGGKSL